MQKVEDVIYDYKIDTVFMHYNYDLNQDHISASKICLTAARHCKNIFYYQSNMYVLPRPFNPTFFVDISDTLDKKREVLYSYAGDHNRFNELFEINIERNRVWGYSNHVKYAEGFKGEISLKCGDGNTLILSRLQREGRPEMWAEDYIRAFGDGFMKSV